MGISNPNWRHGKYSQPAHGCAADSEIEADLKVVQDLLHSYQNSASVGKALKKLAQTLVHAHTLDLRRRARTDTQHNKAAREATRQRHMRRAKSEAVMRASATVWPSLSAHFCVQWKLRDCTRLSLAHHASDDHDARFGNAIRELRFANELSNEAWPLDGRIHQGITKLSCAINDAKQTIIDQATFIDHNVPVQPVMCELPDSDTGPLEDLSLIWHISTFPSRKLANSYIAKLKNKAPHGVLWMNSPSSCRKRSTGIYVSPATFDTLQVVPMHELYTSKRHSLYFKYWGEKLRTLYMKSPKPFKKNRFKKNFTGLKTKMLNKSWSDQQKLVDANRHALSGW